MIIFTTILSRWTSSLNLFTFVDFGVYTKQNYKLDWSLSGFQLFRNVVLHVTSVSYVYYKVLMTDKLYFELETFDLDFDCLSGFNQSNI